MKTTKKLLILCTLLSSAFGVKAQIEYPLDSALVNPLAYPREISANREIALIWDEKDDNNDYKMRHKFFDVNQLSINDMNSAIALQTNNPTYTSAPDNEGNHHIGSCSGDFNGDQIDDYVCATQAAGFAINLRSYNAQIQGTQMTVNLGGTGSNAGPLTMTEGDAGFMRLAAGNFDNNPDDEIILVYRHDASDELLITMYDFDANLNLTEVAYTTDEFAFLVGDFESFDMIVVDLDYDNNDEIILASAQLEGGYYKPFVKVYDATFSMITAKQQTFVPTNITSNERMTIALTSGDFNNDYIKEIALAYGIQVQDNPGNVPDTWLRLFRVGDDVVNTPFPIDWLEKTVLLPETYETTKSINHLQNLDLDAGDVDGDGYEEIVLATGEEVQLFEIATNFQISTYQPLGATYSNSTDVFYDQFVTVGDMNNDGTAEVLLVRNWVDDGDQQQYFSISVYLWNDQTLAWQALAANNDLMPMYYSGTGNLRQYSVVIGDFDGDNLFFGDYEHYTITDVVQPIIILNAPPTHSDNVGENDWTDVNGIWESGDCSGFTSHYSETTSQSFTVQTTVSNAWSVSAGVEAGFEGLVVNASASLEASYGENYTNTNSNTTTTSEVTVTTTCFDDAVYASIVTYDVYEYPLYVGDTLICYVVSVHPRMNDIQYQWISTKSDQGQYFVTKHEPGSLLSYRPFSSPQFNFSAEDEFNAGDNINLSTTISNAWEVTTEQVAESSADTERSIGLATSGSLGAFGVTATVSGSYDWTGISTHASSVGEAIAVGLDVGTMPLSAVNSLYAIKPYIFWGEGNEVVLDYEVNANGQFYQNNYSIQDPAWNLPWRLDEERGYTLDAQTKVRQSKSIWFDKKFPSPGDTITAYARVFNYSLVATESPVEVQFFYGNPYNGGVPVTSIDGDETVTTDLPIASQQYKEVSMTIVLPEDFQDDGRLYAMIDPDSVMNEVHEENNLCWRALGPFFPMSNDDFEEVGVDELVNENELICYPNPTSGILDVYCQLARPGNAELLLFNAQGQQIMQRNLTEKSNGFVHEQLSMDSLPEGVYLIQISTDKSKTTSRIVKK
ncbi:MAG: T9SS type A sorting domain-containing protein [Flavobacteriales bacterium]